MKKLLLALFLFLAMPNLNFSNLDSSPLIGPQTAVAQEVEEEKSSVELEDSSIEIKRASDMEDHEFELPEWAYSVLSFLESIPGVGKHLVMIMGFMGAIAVGFTFLAGALDMLSWVLIKFTDREKSPGWLKKAKEWVDKIADAAKQLSMHNRQKKKKSV